MKTWLAATAVALTLAVAPVQAQTRDDVIAALNANFGDAEAFVTAFDAIQAAVAAGDGEALAEYMPYGQPLMVNGEEVILDSEHDFYARYDELITPAIAEVIEKQTFETLFVNAEGVMFGDGQVWMTGVCEDDSCAAFDVKIITLQDTE